MIEYTEEIDEVSLVKLSKDLKKASETMSPDEARFLVSTYYKMQDQRIRTGKQAKDLGDQPHEVIKWLFGNFKTLEKMVASALYPYAKSKPLGKWVMSICGIGHVLASGLLAHIDVTKPTPGHIYGYAGLNPGAVWLGKDASGRIIKALIDDNAVIGHEKFVEIALAMGACPKWLARRVYKAITGDHVAFKGWEALSDLEYVGRVLDGLKPKKKAIVAAVSKRPWNSELKTLLTFKVAESFVQQQSRESDYYGKMYGERKQIEIQRNESGKYADTATAKLAAVNIGKTTDAYKWYSGQVTAQASRAYWEGKKATPQIKPDLVEPGKGLPMLPPAHLHRRACRWVVKIFVMHYHAVGHFIKLGHLPPKLYVVAHMGHAHVIPPPNMGLVPGLEDAWGKMYGS